jgi:two-component system nitrogen regulation sensor histidine kinase NtrY
VNKTIPDQEIKQRKIRQRRIRYIIAACLVLFLISTYLEGHVYQLGTVSFPVSGNVLVFALININVILLLLMVFLVLRNLVELVFERRRSVLGSRLRTKLVISFVSLSLIPTTLLFFIALQFVSTSMDYWFNINVDKSLEQSLNLAQDVYQDVSDLVARQGATLAEFLVEKDFSNLDGISTYLREQIDLHDLSGLSIITSNNTAILDVLIDEVTANEVPDIPKALIRRTINGEIGVNTSQSIVAGELVRGLAAFKTPHNDETYLLITTKLIPRDRLERMEIISTGVQGYKQLLLLKKPIKTSLLVMLLIVTLLIIFSAIWFGFYVADGLTRPMGKLASGIKRVADGELDFVLEKDSGDEMGTLVESFNLMTKDLHSSKIQVEEGHFALKRVNEETERRRRYTEIILQNVTTGVIALDAHGRVITINKFAEELLKVRKEEVVHKSYKSILRLNHLGILESFFIELADSGKSSIQRPLKITVNNETLSLRVNFSKLEDDDGQPIGVVIVFDNLTEIEKIQRMAAWREVARRIAHEVKNPLTPIQLSAQRLRKRYLDVIEGDIFDQCTRTIIIQVEELKRLVSEFSSFARMPAIRKTQSNLVNMVNEVFFLYREAHKNISFEMKTDEIPLFMFDVEQLRRVVVNLLDNAVAACEQQNDSKIDILIHKNDIEKLLFIEVADNGPGVTDADKVKLFEPYFSTKKTGTGLGLAIASTVVSDHGGYLKVIDNQPSGARFVVELPFTKDV